MTTADRQARFREKRERELAQLKAELQALRDAVPIDTSEEMKWWCAGDLRSGREMRVMVDDYAKLIEEFNELVDDYDDVVPIQPESVVLALPA